MDTLHKARPMGEFPRLMQTTDDKRRSKRPAVHPPQWLRTEEREAGCRERVPPRYEPCGEEIAADSGAYCDGHKIDVRRSV